jgi:UTP--glucose-1-phosphate uridylyltransferase
LVARDLVGDEPFAVLLGDVLIPGKNPATKQLIAVYEATRIGAIAVEEVPPDETHQYGVVSIGKDFGQTFEITAMVEKPAKGTAPSNFIITGRYVLEPEIFPILEKSEKGAGGEIQLTDGMKALAKSQAFHGVRFDGKTYDCGAKLGFLSANIAFALTNPELAPLLKGELKKIVGTL